MRHMSDTDRLWIRRYGEAAPGAPTLVCLPHAGGSATFFLPLARALAPRCEVLAIQYPGRQDRFAERPVESIGELADRILPLLRRESAGRSGPPAFFGHSMGALVAFELARRFEESGTASGGLFVSAGPAPSRPRGRGNVHLGTDDQLIEVLRSLNGTQPELLADKDFLSLTLPALRGDYKALETYRYRPGPPLACPVHALRGDADPVATEEGMRAWGAHTGGAFTLHTYRGGHFYLVEHQAEVLGVIERSLLDGRASE